MKNKYIKIIIFISIILSGTDTFALSRAFKTVEYTIHLYDTARERLIPMAIYSPEKVTEKTKVIIFSHGYDRNKGGSYKTYSYLTKTLAENGYFVISIQHELPGDELLAMEGNLYLNRLPNWERGVENILFTINEFKKIRPNLKWSGLTLIGHSNGGDMTMLFAADFPHLIKKAISLDHRRMPMPRVNKPELFSLRGCDYEADKGVLPDPGEQKRYAIGIIRLDGIKHSDMDDKGSISQHERICRSILNCLEK